MASRVEIISGSLKGSILDNAATEETLQEVLKALQKMGGSSGPAPSATTSGSSGGNPSSGFSGLNAASSALQGSFTALKVALGTSAGLLANNSGSLASWTKGLSSAASYLPGVGKYIGAFGSALSSGIEALESWNKTLKQVSSTGASFNNSLFEMRIAASNTMMSLDEFASLVKNNSEGFAGMGSTVTQGALAFSKMSKEFLAIGGVGQQLHEMGMSIQDINGGLAKFVGTTMKGTKVTDENMSQLSGLYADYATNLDRLSKLTGQEKNALEEKNKAIQLEAAWTMKMAQMAPEERAKFKATLDEYRARYGEAGAQYVKDIAVNGQAMQKSSRIIESTTPELASAMKQSAASAKDSSVSMNQHLATQKKINEEELPATNRRLKELQHVMNAASGGIGGSATDITNVFAHGVQEHAKYGAEFGKLTKEEIKAKEDAVAAEQNKRNATTQILDAFNVGMKNISNKLTTSFLNGVDQFVIGLGISGKDITEMFENLDKKVNPIIDATVDAFFGIKDFLEDYMYPVFNSLWTIGEVVVESLTELWNVLTVGGGIIDSFFKAIGLGNITTSSLWNTFKEMGRMLVDVTSSGTTLKNALAAVGYSFAESWEKIKLAFFEFLNKLPGINMSKEIEETKAAIKQLGEEKDARALAAAKAATEYRQKLDREEAERKIKREARDEAVAEARRKRDEDSDKKAADRKDEKEKRAEAAAPVPATSNMQKYLQATALVESGGNANAKAKTSSAGGMFQFIDGTWKQMVKEMGKDYTLADKHDPKKSAEVMEYFTKKQQGQLEKGIGRSATNTDLYMSHFLGAGGATKFINAMSKNPNATAADLDPAAAKANASIYFDKSGRARSLQEVYDLMGSKIKKAEDALATGKYGGKAISSDVYAIGGGQTATPVNKSTQLPSGADLAKQEAEKKQREKEEAEKQQKATARKNQSDNTQQAGVKKEEKSLSDVVSVLDGVNSKLSALLDQNKELGEKQIRSIKSNSDNVYAT